MFTKPYRDILKARLGFWKNLTWDGIETYFIVSTGRTGTKSLAKILNQSSRITAFHEPLPTFFEEGNLYLQGKLKKNELSKRIIRDRRHIRKKIEDSGSMTYVESNNRLYSLIPVIQEIFPDPKFIHIVRDGRDIVRSGLSRKWYAHNDQFNRISADVLPSDPFHDEWEDLSRFEKICWWWKKKDETIRSSLKNYDSLLVKFSDIFEEDKNYPGLKSIIDFMEIDLTIDELQISKANSTRKYGIPSYENWSVEKRRKFDRIAGGYLSSYEFFEYNGI